MFKVGFVVVVLFIGCGMFFVVVVAVFFFVFFFGGGGLLLMFTFCPTGSNI